MFFRPIFVTLAAAFARVRPRTNGRRSPRRRPRQDLWRRRSEQWRARNRRSMRQPRHARSSHVKRTTITLPALHPREIDLSQEDISHTQLRMYVESACSPLLTSTGKSRTSVRGSNTAIFTFSDDKRSDGCEETVSFYSNKVEVNAPQNSKTSTECGYLNTLREEFPAPYIESEDAEPIPDEVECTQSEEEESVTSECNILLTKHKTYIKPHHSPSNRDPCTVDDDIPFHFPTTSVTSPLIQDSGFENKNTKVYAPIDEPSSDTVQRVNEESVIILRLWRDGVVLEDAWLTPDGGGLAGTVLVRNECYEKCVFIRHSCNVWKTFKDTTAEWVEPVDGGAVDRFSFSFPHEMPPETSYSIEFAIAFNGKWDNNDRHNYTASCTML